LTFSNLRWRHTSTGVHLTVIDLSALQALPEFRRPKRPKLRGHSNRTGTVPTPTPARPRQLKFHGQVPDTFYLACVFKRRLYDSTAICPLDANNATVLYAESSTPGTLKHAFLTIMRANANHSVSPDFEGIRALMNGTMLY
jgi:hypothetical protein